jgi:hypothetical protein
LKKIFFAFLLSLFSFSSAFPQFLQEDLSLKKISQMNKSSQRMESSKDINLTGGKASLGINAGFAVIEENVGIALGAFVEFKSTNFSFVPQANYWRVSKASNFELAGLGRIYLSPSTVIPYLDGGLGINFYTSDVPGGDFTKLGIIFGGGVELANVGTSFSILFDGKYKLIIRDGGNISGVVVTAGMRFGLQ